MLAARCRQCACFVGSKPQADLWPRGVLLLLYNDPAPSASAHVHCREAAPAHPHSWHTHLNLTPSTPLRPLRPPHPKPQDLLATWKQQLHAPLSKQQAAWQGKLARMLADLGASNITLSPHTPDGLFTCLVQATVKGRTLAIDVPGLESYAGNAKCLVRALAAQSQGKGVVVVTKGLTELPVTPSVLYPQGWVTLHTSPDLPLPDSDPANGGALFGLGFRARAMLVRGWVPVLLPEWDWRAVVRNEDAARRYLADQVMAAIRRAPAHR